MSDQPAKIPIKAVKGTKDILPAEARDWQAVEAAVKAVFELYGYREIRTPIFEATELFEKSTGETSDIVVKEMYTFIDKGGRSITLRPEYTPSVARAVIEHRLYLEPRPLKFYYIGPMFRYDKPQKGRYRQFHQIDIEVFNEPDPGCDAEIVEMADTLLGSLNVTGTETLVNSVGCPKCRPAYHAELKAHASRLERRLCPDCQRKAQTNPLRIFDCKVESCRALTRDFPNIADYLCEECRDHFARFRAYLDLYGIKYRIEPRLVRGIDYYTKTAFEIIAGHEGAQNAILGGGRYDNLMKDFGGPDICGIGFAMGVERLLSVVNPARPKEKFLYLAWMGEEAKRAAMELARFFRAHGIECLVEFKERGLKNQMGRANKLEASWTVIIGEDEIRKAKYQLKDMSTGEQREADRDEIAAVIKGA
jgi:histidyl-tRNA synthetase